MLDQYLSLPGGLTARLASNTRIRFGERERLLLQAYIPCIGFLPVPRKADLTIRHRESARHRMTLRGTTAAIQDTWNGSLSMDVYHLLAGMARLQLLKRKLFTAHTACIGNDGLILLAGHSGSGKTRVVLELFQKHGVKVFSGNKTITSFGKDGVLQAIAGTRAMTARTEDLPCPRPARSAEYGDRTAFLLDDTAYAPAGPIKAIVLVRLNDGVQEWRRLTPLSGLHTLYPFFLDTVNADVIVCGRDILPGTPPPGARAFLAGMLGKALQRIPAYAASGSLPHITDHIARL